MLRPIARTGSVLRRAARAATLLTLVCVAPGARAADAPGWATTLANELMSPYCPGRALPDCPSPQATDLRRWIIAQEESGRTHDEVMGELLGRFGDELLQKPRAEGFGLAAYLVPLAALLAGGAVLLRFLGRQRGPGAPAAAVTPRPAADPELERRLDEELRRARERV